MADMVYTAHTRTRMHVQTTYTAASELHSIGCASTVPSNISTVSGGCVVLLVLVLHVLIGLLDWNL